MKRAAAAVARGTLGEPECLLIEICELTEDTSGLIVDSHGTYCVPVCAPFDKGPAESIKVIA